MSRVSLSYRDCPVAFGFVLVFALSTSSVNEVSAQSGAIQQNSGRQQQSQGTFESRMWNWLAKAQYKNWGPIPGVTGEAYASEQPHGAQVKLFANRTAAANPESLPHGSMLVKENYSSDGSSLLAITIMYRSEGYNPQGGDWYWASYQPDGQISKMEGMSISGKVGVCIDCHRSAEGDDFTFANDR